MEVGFHEPGLIFMKIHRNIFMSIYRIDPRGQFYKCFKSVLSRVYAHIFFIKINSIKILYESRPVVLNLF